MAREQIVIAGAARTPMGAFQGALAGQSAPTLGASAIQAALAGAGLGPEQVDEAFAALDWSLPAEERVILDRVSEVQSPAKWA